jgi:hypothetical protein
VVATAETAANRAATGLAGDAENLATLRCTVLQNWIQVLKGRMHLQRKRRRIWRCRQSRTFGG